MNKEANKYLDIIKEYAPIAIRYGLFGSAGTVLLQYIRNKYNKKISEKEKRKKLLRAALIGGGLGVSAGIVQKSGIVPKLIDKPKPVKKADPEVAEELLASVAHGMQYQSIIAGGNGEKDFIDDYHALSQGIPPIVAKSIHLKNPEARPPQAIDGYVIKIEPGEDGTFKNNFTAVAYPGKGYTGPIMWTDKSTKVQSFDLNKIPPSLLIPKIF